MSDKPRIMLVDLSSIWWQHWSVNHENGMQAARSGTLASIKRASSEWPGLVAICCDSGKSFRKELSPLYKAQREKQPEAAYGELDKTKERLAADGLLLWQAEGFEADDVIATACKAARDAGHEVRIVSADKDLMQLLGPGVDVLRSHTWEVWDDRKVVEKIGVDAGQLGDYLALTGDASDNIPGAPGIGKVRASELLTKFETLERLYVALDAGKEVSTPAIEKSLRENRADVELSRKLVALRFDAPIRFGEIFEERKQESIASQDRDMEDEDEGPKDAPTAAVSGELTPSSSTPSAPAPSSQTALAVVAPVEYERQLEPASIGGAFKLARGLFDSRLYSRFQNPEAIMAVIIRGRELGLGALTALDSFHVIEGRPCPHAYLMIARAKADPDCEYLYCEAETSNAEHSTWITKSRRNPKEQRLTYTMDQAKASGLVKPAQEKTDRDGRKYMAKDNQWVIRPAEMLRKTCGVQLARMEYPAATMGLYAAAELGYDE